MNLICTLNNSHKKPNQLIIFYVLWDAFRELLCIFGNVYASGAQDAEAWVDTTLEGCQG